MQAIQAKYIGDKIFKEEGYNNKVRWVSYRMYEEPAACPACMQADGLLPGHFRCTYPSNSGMAAFECMQRGNRMVRLHNEDGWIIEYADLNSGLPVDKPD